MPLSLFKRVLVFACCASGMLAAHAHEFWMEASPAGAAGGPTTLQLLVGERMAGERVGWTASHARAFRRHDRKGAHDLTASVPRQAMLQEMTVGPLDSGTHVFSYESHPSPVTLEADKFNAYLKDEGLDGILAQRERAGTAGTPGRERFRRSARLVLRMGQGKSDVAARATGQRLEVRPLVDPFGPAGQLRVQVHFDGRPLAGVLVKVWHRDTAGRLVGTARTDAGGKASVAVDGAAGWWLVNVVHMVPTAGEPGVDWDSFWGSLSFRRP